MNVGGIEWESFFDGQKTKDVKDDWIKLLYYIFTKDTNWFELFVICPPSMLHRNVSSFSSSSWENRTKWNQIQMMIINRFLFFSLHSVLFLHLQIIHEYYDWWDQLLYSSSLHFLLLHEDSFFLFCDEIELEMILTLFCFFYDLLSPLQFHPENDNSSDPEGEKGFTPWTLEPGDRDKRRRRWRKPWKWLKHEPGSINNMLSIYVPAFLAA